MSNHSKPGDLFMRFTPSGNRPLIAACALACATLWPALAHAEGSDADENDNGQSVTMAPGDALQITLPENRSTGYVWSVVTNDEAVLRPTDEPAYEIEGEPLPGAGGKVTFTFTAAAAGAVTLRLVNARPQETAVQPVATFELNVQVSE